MNRRRYRYLILLAGIWFVAFDCGTSRGQAPWQVPAPYWNNRSTVVPAGTYYPIQPLGPNAYPAPYCAALPVAPNNDDSNSGTSRRFSPEQKLALIKQHLVEGVPIGQLCTRNGIRPDEYYHWQEQLFTNGAAVFAKNDDKPNGESNRDDSGGADEKIQLLEKKLAIKDEVIDRLVEDSARSKKQAQ